MAKSAATIELENKLAESKAADNRAETSTETMVEVAKENEDWASNGTKHWLALTLDFSNNAEVSIYRNTEAGAGVVIGRESLKSLRDYLNGLNL